mgnify:CR=1 FL=1
MMIQKNSDLSAIFKLGYISAIIMLILVPLQVIIYISLPPPDSVQGFFELYDQSLLLGLLSLDLIYLISNLVIIPLYIGLSAIVYKEHPSLILFALVFTVISLAVYYPSNPSIEMMTLSKHYYETIPSDVTIYFAAGELLLASYTGTSYVAYYILGALSLLLFSFAAFKSSKIPKKIGVWGLISGVFMLIPSSFGIIGMVFSLLSLIPWCVFVFLLAKAFKTLSKNKI